MSCLLQELVLGVDDNDSSVSESRLRGGARDGADQCHFIACSSGATYHASVAGECVSIGTAVPERQRFL